MLADTSVEQFNEWIAMYRLEPWGDDWAQTGTLAAAMFNAEGKPATPVEFIPGGLDRVKGMSDSEVWERAQRSYGAK